jgi:hypothetical protein
MFSDWEANKFLSLTKGFKQFQVNTLEMFPLKSSAEDWSTHISTYTGTQIHTHTHTHVYKEYLELNALADWRPQNMGELRWTSDPLFVILSKYSHFSAHYTLSIFVQTNRRNVNTYSSAQAKLMLVVEVKISEGFLEGP